MSVVEVAADAARPGALVSLLALYRLLLRMQITVTRLLGIAGLGALAILIGLFSPLGRQPGPGRRGRGVDLRARNPRPVRGAVARHVGDRRSRRRPPPRLPLAEARGALAASRRGRARDGQRRPAADRRAARGVRARRGSRRRRARGFPRRFARGARVRRPVRRSGDRVPARCLVGARLRPCVGERRRPHG